MKRVICIAIIHHGKLLLVKKGVAWFLPGGKPEARETEIQTLSRELMEELPELRYEIGEHLGTFEGTTPNSKEPLSAHVYLGQFLCGSIKPAAEVAESCWYPCKEAKELSEVTKAVISQLEATETELKYSLRAYDLDYDRQYHLKPIGPPENPAYAEIVALGKAALPFLLADLQKIISDWRMYAIGQICTNEGISHPTIPKEERGRMQLMVSRIVQWGEDNGYL